MPLNEAQQELAEKLGQMLAQSMLDDELKKSLLENVGKIPEHMLFKLMDALEMESEELERTAFEIDLFLKEQDEDWDKVASDQKKLADEAVDKMAEALS